MCVRQQKHLLREFGKVVTRNPFHSVRGDSNKKRLEDENATNSEGQPPQLPAFLLFLQLLSHSIARSMRRLRDLPPHTEPQPWVSTKNGFPLFLLQSRGVLKHPERRHVAVKATRSTWGKTGRGIPSEAQKEINQFPFVLETIAVVERYRSCF